jgi:hypothetical protein
VILSLAAAMARHRRSALIIAVVLGAIVVTDAVRAAQEPVDALVGTGTVAALALVLGAVVGFVSRVRAPARFEVDAARHAFRTPPGAAAVFVVFFMLAGVAFFAEAGGWSWAHDDRDGGWIAVMALIGVPVLSFTALVWRGIGIALTAEGIHARRETGSAFIPWTALSPEQPAPAAPPDDYHLDLTVTDPGLVTHTGLIRRPNRIAFEGIRPAFAAAAIRHYVTHPAERATIGTEPGHRRLVDLLEIPPTAPEPPPKPAPRRVLLAALLFVVAVSVDSWADLTFGRHSVAGYASDVVSKLLGLAAAGVIVDVLRRKLR